MRIAPCDSSSKRPVSSKCTPIEALSRAPGHMKDMEILERESLETHEGRLTLSVKDPGSGAKDTVL